MSIVIPEPHFHQQLRAKLAVAPAASSAGCVTGPGRSGAIAAVYASHILGIPFVPFGQPGPGPVLVVDTAQQSGQTMRRAIRRYERLGLDAAGVVAFNEPPRVRFWYEQTGGAA